MRHKRARRVKGDLDDLTPKEFACEGVLWPLSVLTGVLHRDDYFRAACASIAAGESSAATEAKRYVRNRRGKGQWVVERLLEFGAEHGPAWLPTIAGWSAMADEPIASTDRRRWVRENAELRHGAEVLATLGAGCCLTLQCRTKPPGRAHYCPDHKPTLAVVERGRDQRAVRTVLEGAAKALEADALSGGREFRYAGGVAQSVAHPASVATGEADLGSKKPRLSGASLR